MTYHAALAALASGINTPEVRAAIRDHVRALEGEIRKEKRLTEFWKGLRKAVFPWAEGGHDPTPRR